jgi:hypothetical protein
MAIWGFFAPGPAVLATRREPAMNPVRRPDAGNLHVGLMSGEGKRTALAAPRPFPTLTASVLNFSFAR